MEKHQVSIRPVSESALITVKRMDITYAVEALSLLKDATHSLHL